MKNRTKYDKKMYIGLQVKFTGYYTPTNALIVYLILF